MNISSPSLHEILWLIEKPDLPYSQCFEVQVLISPNMQNSEIIAIILTSGHHWTNPLLKISKENNTTDFWAPVPIFDYTFCGEFLPYTKQKILL